MSMIVRVYGQRLLYEHVSASICQRLFHEHDRASIWLQALT